MLPLFPAASRCDQIEPHDMNAGPELDALVAEKVMGLPKALVAALALGPRAYSTDIAAAWEVVRRFAEEATRRDVYPTIWWDKQGDYWTCELGKDYVGTGATAPLAICLAALKAVA